MKMINYRLQTEMEQIKSSSTDWYKHYLRGVLESDKPYHVKADYIGLSFQEIQNKIDYLANDIKELQSLKKDLVSAKLIAQEATADVLSEYGIDRMDGTAISSITLAAEKSTTKMSIKITDPDALIKLGYVNIVVDTEAVEQAMLTMEGMDEVDRYIEIVTETKTTPAKIKINSKRSSINNQTTELLNYAVEDAA